MPLLLLGRVVAMSRATVFAAPFAVGRTLLLARTVVVLLGALVFLVF